MLIKQFCAVSMTNLISDIWECDNITKSNQLEKETQAVRQIIQVLNNIFEYTEQNSYLNVNIQYFGYM